MNEADTIYVALLDEAVDVWRPVLAEMLGSGVFLITDQPYDRETERWEFEPGDKVVCEDTEIDRRVITVAVGRA